MKKLIAKIREILRNRRVRKIWTRTVSSIACLVVFVTTYALVLPAITMESQALCGIEAHQHDDSCYEERLTCTIPESEGHTHTEDCYSTKQKLICDRSEHEHNSDCYDENGNLTCSLKEHQHGRECFEETRELVCGLEEAEGHHHDSSCYEKVLTCGKEAHTHSQACYRENAASEMETERAAVASTTAASEGGNTAADANGADRPSDAFGTLDPAQTDSEGFVPASDEANIQEPLNGNTAISNDSPAVDETRGSGNSDAGITSDDSSSAEENITEAVEETHPAVSFEDTLTVYTGSLGSDITGSLSSDTNAGNPGNDAAGSPDTDTAAGTLPASSNLTVSVSAEAGTFPAGTTMVLSAVTDMDAVAEAVEGTVDSKTRGFQAVDISFRDKDGNEIEPLKPISVTMRSDSIKAATEDSSMAPVVVHVEDRNKETAEATDSPAATVIETLPDTAENKEQSETPAATNSPDAISFEADAFSVYAIVYTVDLHYEVNGKMYEFSIPGGGFVSLEHLVEVLGIANADAVEVKNTETIENDIYKESIHLNNVLVSEETRNFVSEVASVEFSSPELVWIGKAEAGTTIGQLKEGNKLDVQYSSELTEEQITAINSCTVEAGDWALISIQPFISEESLTVTMKNGDRFVVRVTDAQITKDFITASGETYTITVIYDEDAEIPEGAKLEVSELVNDNEEYIDYVEQAAKALAEGEEIPFVNASRLFDISIVADGKKIEPKAPVEVKITYAKAESVNETSEVGTVHFKESIAKTEAEVMDIDVQGEEGKVEGVTFTTDSFSVYAVIIIDKEAGTFVAEDNDYKVTVTYTKEANLPIGTELTVMEITPEEDRYWKLRKATQDKINEGLEWEYSEMTPDPRKGITDAVFFDISLVYGGNEVEPDVPLLVKIEYKENGMLVPESEDTKIIHFAKTGTEIIDDVNVRYSESVDEHGKYAVAYEYAQGSFSAVGSYSTGEYIEINESNIINPSARILATPSLNAAGDSSITASKTITDEDKDGIYDLTLSVTGQSESSTSTTVNKANVVLVIDTSASMGDNYVFSKDDGTSGTHYGIVDGYYVELTYNDGKWYYRSWGQNYTYTGDRYIYQTRLEATKAAANELVHALLANNKNKTTEDGVSLRDVIEISLVEFSSETREVSGQTSINDATILAQKSTSESTLQGYINNLSAGGGTNWEAALRRAKTAADAYSNQTDEFTSIIFLTDGMPTFYLNNADSRTKGNGGTGAEERDNVHKSWTYAADDAGVLVNAGYTLYNIFAFGTDTVKFYYDNNNTDADYLRALTNYAYTGSGDYYNKTLTDTTRKYFFSAKDTTALQNAFSIIMEKITNSVGFGGVLVDDGVTVGVTSTSVQVNGGIDTNQFHYAIKVGDTTVASVRINESANTATFTIDGNDYSAIGETVTTVIDDKTHTNTVYSVTVGDTEYKISPASFNDAGLVQWDLAGIGSIPNDYTYELSFNVWPNQLSFDMVADLNNGIKTMEQLESEITQSQGEAVWNQISKAFVDNRDGTYSIRTNYEEYVDYYLIESELNDTTGELKTTYTSMDRVQLGPKDPVPLTSTTMSLRKIWDDSLDRDQTDKILWKDITRDENGKVANQTAANSNQYHVKLHVWKADTLSDLQTKISRYADADADGSYSQADDNDYIDKTLGWNSTKAVYDWDETLEVSPGTMVKLATAQEMEVDLSSHTQITYNGQTYVILETGHYYTVTEENIDSHFELNPIMYHPMLVDGVLCNVTFNEDGTVENIVPMSTVDATNTLRGGINIKKTVKDSNDNKLNYDGLFKAAITLTPSDNPDNIEDYWVGTGEDKVSKGKVAWYYYVDESGKQIYDEALIQEGILEDSGETNSYGRIGTGENYDGGGWFVLWFRKGEEALHNAAGTLTLSSKYPIRFTNMAAGIGYSLEETDTNGMTPSVTYSHEDADGNTVDGGHVVMGNTANNIDVVNKTTTAKIKVLKVDMVNTSIHLDGVKFELYADEACTKQITKNASGTDLGGTETIDGVEHKAVLTTDANGEISLGALVKGTYYLREIKPKAGYIMLSENIVINILDDKVKYGTSMTEAESAEGIYTVVVRNSAGVALPNTGGPGTRLFTILGSILVFGAGALLWRRRRFI